MKRRLTLKMAIGHLRLYTWNPNGHLRARLIRGAGTINAIFYLHTLMDNGYRTDASAMALRLQLTAITWDIPQRRRRSDHKPLCSPMKTLAIV